MKQKILIRDLVPKVADWSKGEVYSYIEKPTGILRVCIITLSIFAVLFMLCAQQKIIDYFTNKHEPRITSQTGSPSVLTGNNHR